LNKTHIPCPVFSVQSAVILGRLYYSARTAEPMYTPMLTNQKKAKALTVSFHIVVWTWSYSVPVWNWA